MGGASEGKREERGETGNISLLSRGELRRLC